MATRPKPWEKQEGESLESAGRFFAYRDMPRPRSIRTLSETLGVPRTALEEASAGWLWVDRCKQWDARLAKLEARAQETASQRNGRRQAKVARDLMTLAQRELTGLLKRPHETLTPKEAIAAATAAIKLQRLLTGDTTENVHVTSEPVDLRSLSPEDLRTYEALSKKARGQTDLT